MTPRTMYGVHDLRFDRVDIGGEVIEEIVLGNPGEALRVDIDIGPVALDRRVASSAGTMVEAIASLPPRHF